ncbi:MAG: nitrate reductase [Bacteroidetes bacterium]|nr:nitrate reductase [Bacteroidota bacterium]
MSTFRSVFIAVVLATALIVTALLVNRERPGLDTERPEADMVAATGRCATCHREETPAIVVEYEKSRHASVGTSCLDCHGLQDGQESLEHRGFTISAAVTALNCQQCHSSQYREFLRSRHAAPAFAAVEGAEPFSDEQVAFSERYHPGAVDRPPNMLARLEGVSAIASGCASCHKIGQPNADGSIGTCTSCHSRHLASIELARLPTTCGQCHMGPDHSQIEIYEESTHGVLFNAQRDEMNLGADPRRLTVADMPVPTCATCHMSGLGGVGVTHDTSERLSYWLFAAVSERRPTYVQAQDNMKAVCGNCHTANHTDAFYEEAEAVVESTNERVLEAKDIMDGLYDADLLTPAPFDEPIEFTYFDYWHYWGRTAKHGAFMGGADFVQWHGNYQLLAQLVELRALAEELRTRHASPTE